MSTHICGCDPEANYRCGLWPQCVVGRREGYYMPSTEERIEAREARESKTQLLTRPTNPKTEVRVTDPVTGGQKGSKLARFVLLPFDALWAVAEHFGRGAEKYEDRNWERGYRWSLSYDALLRHLAADIHGEERDVETGSLHIVAVAWHALVLVAFRLRGVGTDDRSKLAPRSSV